MESGSSSSISKRNNNKKGRGISPLRNYNTKQSHSGDHNEYPSHSSSSSSHRPPGHNTGGYKPGTLIDFDTIYGYKEASKQSDEGRNRMENHRSNRYDSSARNVGRMSSSSYGNLYRHGEFSTISESHAPDCSGPTTTYHPKDANHDHSSSNRHAPYHHFSESSRSSRHLDLTPRELKETRNSSLSITASRRSPQEHQGNPNTPKFYPGKYHVGKSDRRFVSPERKSLQPPLTTVQPPHLRDSQQRGSSSSPRPPSNMEHDEGSTSASTLNLVRQMIGSVPGKETEKETLLSLLNSVEASVQQAQHNNYHWESYSNSSHWEGGGKSSKKLGEDTVGGGKAQQQKQHRHQSSSYRQSQHFSPSSPDPTTGFGIPLNMAPNDHLTQAAKGTPLESSFLPGMPSAPRLLAMSLSRKPLPPQEERSIPLQYRARKQGEFKREMIFAEHEKPYDPQTTQSSQEDKLSSKDPPRTFNSFDFLSKRLCHEFGLCTPCFFKNKPRGCDRGLACRYCHYCSPQRARIVNSWKRKLNPFLPRPPGFWDRDQRPCWEAIEMLYKRQYEEMGYHFFDNEIWEEEG